MLKPPNEVMRAAREKNGKTQADIAAELKVTQGIVAMWETGERTPPTKKIRTIAKVYGVKPETLLPESAA